MLSIFLVRAAAGETAERRFEVRAVTVTWDELLERQATSPQAPVSQEERIDRWMPDGPANLPLPPDAVVSRAPTPAKQAAPQGDVVLPPSPPTTADFRALDDNDTSIPPDTHGSVGPDHLLVTLNSEVRIQNKSGTPLSTVTLENFWSNVTIGNAFDPKSIYDPNSGRFIVISAADDRSASSSLLLAVSVTDDPTQGWHQFKIDVDEDDQIWLDFPNVGVNKNWITCTGNMFNVGNDDFAGSNIWAIDKGSALDGGTANLIPFFRTFEQAGATLAPCLTFSDTEEVQYLVNRWNANDGLLRLHTITGTPASPLFSSTLLFPSSDPWADVLPDAPQQGSTERIETNDSRMQNAVLRNGSLWCAHNAGLPATNATRVGAKWWEIDPLTGNVIQTGVVDDTTSGFFYYFPSISANHLDEVLMGFSASSPDTFVGGYYTFRFPGDPAGQMRAPALLKAGEAKYFKDFGRGSNRWGDYSATAVDPLDDSTFWTIQEYAETPLTRDLWGTWWGKIPSPTFPNVLSILRNDATPTSDSQVAFTVRFNEAVSGVDETDFSLAVSGVASASVVSVVNENGEVWVVTVNTGSGDGTIRLDVVDDDSIVDADDNPLGGAGPGNGDFVSGETYAIDKTPPVVEAITRADANPTNASTVRFRVAFSETVGGVGMDDFLLIGDGVSSPSISSIMAVGEVYFVGVNTGSGDGTLGLDLIDDDSIRDQVSFPLGGAGAGNGDFTEGEVYTIDQSPPDVVDIAVSPEVAGTGAEVTIRITLSETPASAPTVTVGGSPAAFQSQDGLEFTYTILIEEDQPNGSTNIDSVVEDELGNSGVVVSEDVLLVDTIAPEGTLAIDADAPFTQNEMVTLTVSAQDGGENPSGVTEMRFRNEGEAFGEFEAFAPQREWMLTSGDGTKTVFAQFRDGAGNESAEDISDSILLDATPPVSSVTQPEGVATTPVLSLMWSADDGGGSGIASVEVFFSFDGGTSASLGVFAGDVTSADFDSADNGGDGEYSFFSLSTDKAGNVESAPVAPDVTVEVFTQEVTVQQIRDHLLGIEELVEPELTAADVNGDGDVNVADILRKLFE